jgi:hypothetical protein
MRRTLLCVAFTLIALSSFAQDDEGSTIYGVNIGGSFTTLKTSLPGHNIKGAANWGIGVSLDTPISDEFSFFGHVNYERKSFDYDYSYEDNYGEGPVTVTGGGSYTYVFVSVPAGIRYYVGEKKNYFINAGGYMDIFFNVKGTDNGSSSSFLATSSYHESVFGAFAGGGYRLPLSEDNGNDVLFEIRYCKGITDLLYAPPSNKMNSLMIGISYRVDSLGL